jgi:hypothetical protein
MELKHHKLESIKGIILEYLNILPDEIDFTKRKAPTPTIKKMIGYFAQKHFSATQKELSEYLILSSHSGVSLGISSLMSEVEMNPKLKEQLKDLDRIIIEKGLSKLSGKNNEWYLFLDLNNFIIATKGKNSALFHNMNIHQVKEILGESWEYKEHKGTEKFIYKRLANAKN